MAYQALIKEVSGRTVLSIETRFVSWRLKYLTLQLPNIKDIVLLKYSFILILSPCIYLDIFKIRIQNSSVVLFKNP